MVVRYYQAYDNCVGGLIMLNESVKEPDKRRHIGRGGVVLDKEISGAKELEQLRDELKALVMDEQGKGDVTIAFTFYN